MNKRFCKVCGEEIHPLRLKALPSAVTCVEHSSAGRKRGRILSLGEGDHNYNELEVLEEDEFIRVRQLESSRGRGTAKASIALEILDYEKSDTSDDHNALHSASRDYVSDPDQDRLS
jgi:hypothetical protein